MKTNESVKERVMELVDSAGISRKKCAKEIGISYTTLNSIYNHGKVVRVHIILQIANYFDVSMDYVLGLSENKEIKRHRR